MPRTPEIQSARGNIRIPSRVRPAKNLRNFPADPPFDSAGGNQPAHINSIHLIKVKTTLKLTLTTLGAIVLCTGSLTAADKDGADRKRPEGAKPEANARLLERFDKDGDGKLSDAERAAAKAAMADRGGKGGEEMRAKLLKEFDKDGDGQLDEGERAAAKKAMEARRGDKPRPDGDRKPRPEGDRKPKTDA